VKEAADGKALLLAVHYPPYSAAANFVERGDPTLGPTAGAATLEPLALILQRAFRQSGQFPDAVFSAHAHLYQRLTYQYPDGRQIPYLIVGSGGHPPIEAIERTCDKSHKDKPQLPGSLVLPKGFKLPQDESAWLDAYNDRHFGFLRITLDRNRQTLMGEFFAVANEAGNLDDAGAPADSFAVDLQRHVIRP